MFPAGSSPVIDFGRGAVRAAPTGTSVVIRGYVMHYMFSGRGGRSANTVQTTVPCRTCGALLQAVHT